MILSINVRNESLYSLDTRTIRTVSIVSNMCIDITMNLGFCIDDLKIYTESVDECHQIYDRIVYCINNPTEAISFSKEYLRIGCENKEEDSDDQ